MKHWIIFAWVIVFSWIGLAQQPITCVKKHLTLDGHTWDFCPSLLTSVQSRFLVFANKKAVFVHDIQTHETKKIAQPDIKNIMGGCAALMETSDGQFTLWQPGTQGPVTLRDHDVSSAYQALGEVWGLQDCQPVKTRKNKRLRIYGLKCKHRIINPARVLKACMKKRIHVLGANKKRFIHPRRDGTNLASVDFARNTDWGLIYAITVPWATDKWMTDRDILPSRYILAVEKGCSTFVWTGKGFSAIKKTKNIALLSLAEIKKIMDTGVGKQGLVINGTFYTKELSAAKQKRIIGWIPDKAPYVFATPGLADPTVLSGLLKCKIPKTHVKIKTYKQLKKIDCDLDRDGKPETYTFGVKIPAVRFFHAGNYVLSVAKKNKTRIKVGEADAVDEQNGPVSWPAFFKKAGKNTELTPTDEGPASYTDVTCEDNSLLVSSSEGSDNYVYSTTIKIGLSAGKPAISSTILNAREMHLETTLTIDWTSGGIKLVIYNGDSDVEKRFTGRIIAGKNQKPPKGYKILTWNGAGEITYTPVNKKTPLSNEQNRLLCHKNKCVLILKNANPTWDLPTKLVSSEI